MTVGLMATAYGVNLGTSKLAAGFSLGYQANNEPPTKEIMVMDVDWSPTSIRFIVGECPSRPHPVRHHDSARSNGPAKIARTLPFPRPGTRSSRSG
jgi:hypothetical protein